MNDLKEIGFYTLSSKRAQNAWIDTPMQRVEIIITEYCNFNCPYCRGLDTIIYGNRPVKQLSFKEIKQNIDWLLPIENIRFSGGEPTLHKNIVDIVKYAKAKEIKRIAISTNGSNKLELYKELIQNGCNDFSISLDACCAEDGDKMAGGVKGAWNIVTKNIEEISKLCYVTVGIVLTPDNVNRTVETVRFAHQLGVADIRIISAAQWNKKLTGLEQIEQEILDAHPILKFRVMNFLKGENVRGMQTSDSKRCGLVLDDVAIAGDYQYPCIIFMREKGKAISKVGPNMRQERLNWYKTHNCLGDPICFSNCLEVCRAYNNIFEQLNVKSIKSRAF